MTPVSFQDKVPTLENDAPEVNQLTAANVNELKAAINAAIELLALAGQPLGPLLLTEQGGIQGAVQVRGGTPAQLADIPLKLEELAIVRDPVTGNPVGLRAGDGSTNGGHPLIDRSAACALTANFSVTGQNFTAVPGLEITLPPGQFSITVNLSAFTSEGNEGDAEIAYRILGASNNFSGFFSIMSLLDGDTFSFANPGGVVRNGIPPDANLVIFATGFVELSEETTMTLEMRTSNDSSAYLRSGSSISYIRIDAP